MKITIYTTNECQFSKQEKDFLTSHSLQFEEKNLETNREYLTEMLTISNNFAGTPVTKIEKDNAEVVVLKGFTQAEFEKELGLAPAASSTPTAPPAPEVAAPAPAIETPAMPSPIPAAEPAHEEVPPALAPVEASMQTPTDTSALSPAPLMSMAEAPHEEVTATQPAAMDTSLPPLDLPATPEPTPPAPMNPEPVQEPPAAPPAPEVSVPAAEPAAPADNNDLNPQQNQALNSILTSLQTNIGDSSSESKPSDTSNPNLSSN